MTHLKLHYKSLILILLLSFIPAVSAETTFFDDPNDVFIMGEIIEEESITLIAPSVGGGGEEVVEAPITFPTIFADTVELSLGFMSAIEKMMSDYLSPKTKVVSDEIYIRHTKDTNYIAVIISLLFIVAILALNQKHPYSRQNKHELFKR